MKTQNGGAAMPRDRKSRRFPGKQKAFRAPEFSEFQGPAGGSSSKSEGQAKNGAAPKRGVKDVEKSVFIQNAAGEKLVGILERPAKASSTLVILVHGLAGTKEESVLVFLARELVQAGFATLRYDASGNGESEGEFIEGTYAKALSDLSSVLERCSSEFSRFVLVGHSMGGGVVAAAALDERVVGVVTLAGVGKPADFARRHPELTEKIAADGNAYLWEETFGKRYPIDGRFFASAAELNVLARARMASCPALVIAGTRDTHIPTEEGKALAEAFARAMFVKIPADHWFDARSPSRDATFTALAGIVVPWIAGNCGSPS